MQGGTAVTVMNKNDPWKYAYINPLWGAEPIIISEKLKALST